MSTKGFGNLASKSSRNSQRFNNASTPGAGHYNTVNSDCSARKNFSRGFTSSFQKPIAVQKENVVNAPAPNSYNIADPNLYKYKTNNVSASSAFKSQSKRSLVNYGDVKNHPSPATYNVDDNLVHASTKVPFSSFKSKSERQPFNQNKDFPG